jgi:hypothetical protein
MDTAVDDERIAQPAEKPPAVSAVSSDFGTLSENNGIAVADDECTLTLSINRRKWIAQIDAVDRHCLPRRSKASTPMLLHYNRQSHY